MAYTNSPLVTYTNISPNKTVNRNHAIDTITIHCAVAQWTAKQGCDYFASEDVGASCNYFVGTDGSIGLCVEEKDRSWCSSSSSNDHRAITIETASDTFHPYAVTDAAYNALIDLLVDICQRNGIASLKWKADKSLIGQVDQQNMTVHRWFANKACPGEYLYERHGQIASAVNYRLSTGGQAPEEPEEPETPDTPVTPVSYDEYIWHYLMNKIGNEYGVAGLMGNLYAESGLRPNNLQNSYEDSLGYTDASYTAAVDSGAYSKDEFVNDAAGYGLAQWTYWSRKQAMYEKWKSGGYSSIADIDLALDFLWEELNTLFPSVLSTLRDASTIREASDKVLHDFEAPADQSTAVEETRELYGLVYYEKFTGYTPTPRPDKNRDGLPLWLLVAATRRH